MPGAGRLTRPRRSFAALALLAAGLAARLLSSRAALRGGRVYYFDTDDYYHLRRMMTAAENFPNLPSFDPYLGFPTGFRVNWPPLYDWCAGFVMRLTVGAHPGLRAASAVAALIPPLAGVATLALFYPLARRLGGRRAALAALAIAAVLPLLVFYTMLGRPDHHCFENFWFAAILLAVLRLFDAADERSRARAAAAAAACAAAGVLFWIGSEVVVFALLGFFAVEAALPARFKPGNARAFVWLGRALLLEAVLLLPFCARSSWGRAGAALFDAPSLFQPLLAAAAGFWILGLHGRRGGVSRGWAAAALAAAAAASAVLAARGFSSVAAYAAGPVPVFRYAPEMQPLLAPFGRWDAAYVRANFGWAFWLLPPLAVLFAFAARRSPGRRLLLIWTAVCAALALTQARYAYELSLPAALLLGWGAARAAGRRRAALAAAVVLVLLAPALKNLAALPLSPPESVAVGEDLLDACDWLREHTPPTRSLWRGEGAPEYGVYAVNDVGDEVAAIGQRPAAAGNMHFLKDRVEDSIAFFLMQDQGQAYAFLSARRFRYVVLGDRVHDQSLQLDQQLYRWNGAALLPYDGSARPPFWTLVYSRLYLLDGSLTTLDGNVIPPIGHFRLVYESPHAAFGAARDKIFEVVPGARLTGSCSPGAVSAEVPVRTNQGREFAYRTLAPCASGRYELNAPYPGRYAVLSRRRRGAADVAEADVESGAEKPVR